MFEILTLVPYCKYQTCINVRIENMYISCYYFVSINFESGRIDNIL
uniref:Uncharacterized protein n=1 Tax=Arabidopsis thaliana TaxID=3702 RepID=Q0WL37_ARATH|nr:hypothetical protein [Arabidopsis thaliana]